jgi:Spy/CpxP family protein refolding chaperone
MKKFVIVLVSVTLFAIWAVPGFTQGPGMWRRGGYHGMGMRGGPGMMLPLMLKKLDLTPEQQAKVDQIMESHRANFRKFFPQMEAAHEAFAAKLFTPGPLTAADVSDQTVQISQLREQLMQEGLAVALEVRNLLTPEQLAKAAELHTKMKTLRAEMRGVMEDKE